MLRQISYRVLCATNELCRVSPTLAKLLTCETNSRTYRRQGITYDDDSVYEDSDSLAPSSRHLRPGGDDYNNKRQYSRRHDEFENNYRRTFKNYKESNYRNRNSFRDEDDYNNPDEYENNYRKPYRKSFRDGDGYSNQRSFHRSNFGSGFNESFGQRLVKPIFDVNQLPPVEKHFYVEHPAVVERSLEEVESYRKGLSMTARGSDIPKPITNFDELCLPDTLKNAVTLQGYSEPTPIQAQGWPIALSGRDMVGISQTGSGKTLVFILPAIIHALNQPKSEERFNDCSPQVLVLAPTRELVQQIMGVSNTFSQSCGLISACAYGGASKGSQLRCLQGAHICVATPGRLIDFVSEGSVDLRRCTYLVLDEADRMLDMGFEPQIRQIVEQTRPERQTLMWSATWPREIQTLAEDFLTDYVQVTVGAGELVANPKIEQNIHIVEEHEKKKRLESLLEGIAAENNKVLVFAQTKRTVDFLGRHLNSLGIKVMCIHGDVSQARRDQVLNTFRRNQSCVLIATDVAARGLDISNVQCVINYDFPPNIEDYIHRIGRTARGDASGIAHSLLTHENHGIVKDLAAVMKQANQNIPKELYSLVNKHPRNRSKGYSRPRRFDFQRREAANW